MLMEVEEPSEAVNRAKWCAEQSGAKKVNDSSRAGDGSLFANFKILNIISMKLFLLNEFYYPIV